MNDANEQPLRRRDLLGLAIVTTAFAAAAGQAAAQQVCEVDTNNAGRAAMRKTLEYVSPSKTPGQSCSSCAFFTKTATSCGSCQLLNGPVSPNAVCGSWAKKK